MRLAYPRARSIGLGPRRARSLKLSNDRFFIEKVRDIVGLYLNMPEHALCTQPLLPMGLGYVQGIAHDCVRSGNLY